MKEKKNERENTIKSQQDVSLVKRLHYFHPKRNEQIFTQQNGTIEVFSLKKALLLALKTII